MRERERVCVCACVDTLSPASTYPAHKKETKAQHIECMRAKMREKASGRENESSMCEDSFVDGFMERGA